MEHLIEIIGKRRLPAILILDLDYRLLYSSGEIRALFPGIFENSPEKPDLPQEIIRLCERTKPCSASGPPWSPHIQSDCSLIVNGEAQFFSLRAFPIHGHSNPGAIMVIAEKVVEMRDFDFEKIKKKFILSSREVEVIRQICAGLSNKAIAEKLFISEHTVKDHLKSLMRKMKVASRSEIVAAIR
jgi:DNA-binding CsgD family transcriptional regulator